MEPDVLMNSTTFWDNELYVEPMDKCLPIYLYKDYTQIQPVLISIIIMYFIVMIFAVFGNLLVIWTVWKNTHMQTVTNCYIVNLAIADLFVAILVLPLKLLEYTSPCSWDIFNLDGLCAFMSYALPVFVFASVLTLVAISLERYYAVVHPLSAIKISSKSRTKKIIAVTWAVPMVVALPYLYNGSSKFTVFSEYGQISRQTCEDKFDNIHENFRRLFFLTLFFLLYFLPMVIIIGTCTKIAICLVQPINIEDTRVSRMRGLRRSDEMNKRKVARMVIVIAVAFIISWSPQYIVSVVSQLQQNSFLRESNYLFTMLLTHLCGFLNSCFNPFIYTAMSKRFRNSFGQTLRHIFRLCSCKHRFLRHRGHESQRRSTAFTSVLTEPEADMLQVSGNGHPHKQDRIEMRTHIRLSQKQWKKSRSQDNGYESCVH